MPIWRWIRIFEIWLFNLILLNVKSNITFCASLTLTRFFLKFAILKKMIALILKKKMLSKINKPFLIVKYSKLELISDLYSLKSQIKYYSPNVWPEKMSKSLKNNKKIYIILSISTNRSYLSESYFLKPLKFLLTDCL